MTFAMALLGSSFAAFGAFAEASPPPPSSGLCGMTIFDDLDLNYDLACGGNGITVGADGVEIELNGHTIRGPSRGPPSRGITVSGRTDVLIVGPGTITNFRTGIAIMNSHDIEVERVTVADNGVRAFGDGDGVRIIASTDVEIEKCVIVGNGNDGVEIMASSEVELEKNAISGNGNGIRLAAMGNEIEKNVLTVNACGIKGSTVGNMLRGNKFKDNAFDFCA